jgi:hypothetical protein
MTPMKCSRTSWLASSPQQNQRYGEDYQHDEPMLEDEDDAAEAELARQFAANAAAALLR